MSSANAQSRIDEVQGVAEASVLDPATHDWEDLDLTPRARKTVQEIARRVSNGKRVAALFSGPAGAGKTRAASLLARELDRQVIHVDLSELPGDDRSGDTQQVLDKVFASADPESSVLLFDEAEALFGKTNTADSGAPPSPTEQHFLEQIARFPGLTIVATHQCRRIDPQLVRRLHYTVRI
ncbi:AAA family ATPase [Proteobacteria bacterium 005FR1]|nr:AAA family ATPase [Proteobacteria bacterium 005FR1]